MVTLLGSHVVRPAESTPQGRTYIPPPDHVQPITHAPTIYFYRPNGNFSFSTAVETLRSSLSQVLVHFYPLAGRLQWAGAGGRTVVDCNGLGAVVIEAEYDGPVDDFGDFWPTPELRKQLIPPVDYDAPLHEIPLLLVQLTKFTCGGISLGVVINHVLADGSSALHFIGEWAKFARGQPLDIPPVLDRTLLKPRDPPIFSFEHSEYKPPPLLIGQPNDLEERKKQTTIAKLRLSKSQVDKLKDMANEGRADHVRPYTRNEAIAGHLWRCASKARGHQTEQLTNLRVIVNIRNRVQPPLPPGYFGNAILPTLRTAQVGKLLSEPLGYAASKLREAVEEMTGEYARSAIDFLSCQPDLEKFRRFHTLGCTRGAFAGNPNLDVTSWLGLPIYDADFGWGKEIYMGPGAIGFDGKCFVLPSHCRDGSIDVICRFQVVHIEAFKRFIYEDIKNSN